MAWAKKGNLKGPKGDTGAQGPAASTTDVFKAAHPVGSYYETSGQNPPSGGGYLVEGTQTGDEPVQADILIRE